MVKHSGTLLGLLLWILAGCESRWSGGVASRPANAQDSTPKATSATVPAILPAISEVMPSLSGALTKHGIDPSSLRVLYRRGEREVYGLRVHGSKAVDLWQTLRALVAETGHWPVLLGAGEAEHGTGDEIDPRTPEEIIRLGSKLSPTEWLEKRSAAEPDIYRVKQGNWPKKFKPNKSFTLPFNLLTRKPLPEVVVALVPTSVSWEVPAYLGFGGWNECPGPEVHVAMLKRWKRLFGAEVVGISDDTMEVQVTSPPVSPAQALGLAREQFIYCSDIVHQGTLTLENLAAGLLAGRVWYFWWD